VQIALEALPLGVARFDDPGPRRAKLLVCLRVRDRLPDELGEPRQTQLVAGLEVARPRSRNRDRAPEGAVDHDRRRDRAANADVVSDAPCEVSLERGIVLDPRWLSGAENANRSAVAGELDDGSDRKRTVARVVPAADDSHRALVLVPDEMRRFAFEQLGDLLRNRREQLVRRRSLGDERRHAAERGLLVEHASALGDVDAAHEHDVAAFDDVGHEAALPRDQPLRPVPRDPHGVALGRLLAGHGRANRSLGVRAILGTHEHLPEQLVAHGRALVPEQVACRAVQPVRSDPALVIHDDEDARRRVPDRAQERGLALDVALGLLPVGDVDAGDEELLRGQLRDVPGNDAPFAPVMLELFRRAIRNRSLDGGAVLRVDEHFPKRQPADPFVVHDPRRLGQCVVETFDSSI
jgi:hypothetical protein